MPEFKSKIEKEKKKLFLFEVCTEELHLWNCWCCYVIFVHRFFSFLNLYILREKKSLLPFLTIKSASTGGSDSDLSKLSIDLK